MLLENECMRNLKRALGIALVFTGAGLGAASAAPALPTFGLSAGDDLTTSVADRGHRRRMHHHRAHRRHIMRNHRRHGHPNARNPSRPGYMQQLGTTSGGRHY